MKTSLFSYSLCALAFVGCSSKDEPIGAHERVETELRGKLDFVLADRVRAVEVFDFVSGERGDRVCRTESDPSGAFACNLGALSGSFLVSAEVDRSVPVRAFVRGLDVGGARDSNIVSPITSLAVAYVEGLIARGMHPEDAMAKGVRLVGQHFGGLAHESIVPVDVRSTRVDTLTDGAVAGVLIMGFDALAQDYAEGPGGNRALVGREALVAALEADVSADGVFDGKGSRGPVRVGSKTLTGDTLRAEYARSVLRWLGSDENQSSLTALDFASLLTAISEDRSELFDPDQAPAMIDGAGPQIARVTFVKDGVELPADAPIGGEVSLKVVAEDPSGVKAVEGAVASAPSVSVAGTRSPDGEWLLVIDTRTVQDGPHTIVLRTTDTAGNATESTRAVVIDNTPPNLEVNAAGVVQAPQVRVTGTVHDAIGPVDRIVIERADISIVLENPTIAFEAEVQLECAAPGEILVAALDAAGNRTEKAVVVRCDSTPPLLTFIQETFEQEGRLSAIYSNDGLAVNYAYSGAPEWISLDANTAWPVTIEKYFNRLDAGSPNLPRLSMSAWDGGGTTTVDYRYLVEGGLIRDWTPLVPVSDGQYALPLSYVSLDARLGAGSTDDLHRVEVRARDGAGNESMLGAEFHMRLLSPPVWIGGCGLASSLHNFTLQNGRLSEIYTTRPETQVLHGTARYATGVSGTASLANVDNVRVSVTPGEVTSRITQLSEDRHRGANYQINPSLGFYDWCPATGQGAYQILDSGRFVFNCQTPLFPNERVSWISATSGDVNDVHPEPVKTSMVRAGYGAVIPNVDASFNLVPDETYAVEVSLDDPSLLLGGVNYDWARTFVVPPGYTPSSVPSRYRIAAPVYNREGVNYEWVNNVAVSWRFVTRAFISGFEIGVGPLTAVASHAALEDVVVGVQLAPECQTALSYLTQL